MSIFLFIIIMRFLFCRAYEDTNYWSEEPTEGELIGTLVVCIFTIALFILVNIVNIVYNGVRRVMVR